MGMMTGSRVRTVGALTLVALLTASCIGSSVPTGVDMATGKAKLLAAASDHGALAGTEIDDFGFDLLRQLDSNGNLCVSPTSIALALAMVRPGAKGTTAAEMDQVLHSFGSEGQASEIVALLDELRSQTINDAIHAYPTPAHTRSTPGVELDVSDAAFAQKGMPLEPAYLDALSSGFGSGVGLLDYKADPEGARLAINRWASERTKGRVPEVLHQGDVTRDTRLALANAIYLNAGWTFPFDPSRTEDRPFTTAAGSSISIPTMALIDEKVPYVEGSGYRAVDLPFAGGFGGSLSMTVVVPDDMAAFVGSLSAAEFAGIVAGEHDYEVDLTLPRFSADSRIELKPVLAAMGMPTIFTDQADLSGITTDPLLTLEHVIHQANIDVYEQGTTASAVTVALAVPVSGAEHVRFEVNKPFLYFIRENKSGAVLFMGRIDDPTG
jgi:serpin B